MIMYNPPHPGEFIQVTYMEPFDISCQVLAEHLGVAISTIKRLLKQQSRISPEMALRLSKTLGRSPESWLAMQSVYDLWIAQQKCNLANVRRINFSTTHQLLT